MLKATAVLVLVIFLSACALLFDPMDAPSEGVTLALFKSDCNYLKIKESQIEDRNLVSIDRQQKLGGKCSVQCALTKGYVGYEYANDWCKRAADKEEGIQFLNEEAKDQVRYKAQREAEESNDRRLADLAAAYERKGYKKLTFDDFRLDEKSMPQGRRVFMYGYYESWQNWQHLANCDNCDHFRRTVPINTDSAPREVRKRLIEFQSGRWQCPANYGACALMIVGRTDRCSYTEWGNLKIGACIALDDFHELNKRPEEI